VMEELKLFPQTVEQGSKALFFNLGTEESRKAYQLLQEIRKDGIAAEIYHEQAKFDKQFKYAEKKGIPFVIIIGSKELEAGICMVKDIRNGQQQEVAFDLLASHLR
jgi:histidyl-tRNA synthetase